MKTETPVKKETPLNYLEQIRTKLWGGPEYGNVGLMVGAGFSRNAENRSLKVLPFPQWGDIAQKMHDELYPASLDSKKLDYLKIADEYEATFGRARLNELLQEIIPDKDYSPGKLHKMLLKLPWAEIFTTNYDTLLERTLPYVHNRKYDVIKTIDGIHNSRKPRIVKLHGSFPDTLPYTITEEDFRLYPTSKAAFVNMVQQSLMENIFCLIGFSGEDPNFLKWTGWIRDNLGSNRRQIFLLGIFDFSEPQKRLFEKRGIVPIDLSSRFPKEEWPDENLRRSIAMEWFFFYLKKGAPLNPNSWPNFSQFVPFDDIPGENIPEIPDSHCSKYLGQRSWSPPPNDSNEKGENKDKIKEYLKKVLEGWKIEKDHYPGWLVAPEKSRIELWDNTNSMLGFIISNMNELSWQDKLELLFLLNWRLEKCLIPMSLLMPDSLDIIEKFLEEINPSDFLGKTNDVAAASFYWAELAFSLLRNARERFELERFTIWRERLEKICCQKREWETRLYYERCMLALYKLDFEEVFKILDEWPEFLENLQWEIKRLGILSELGDIDGSIILAEKILSKIRDNQVPGQADFYLYSMEAAVMVELKNSRNGKVADDNYWERLEQLNHYHCNPFQEIEKIESYLQSSEPKSKPSISFVDEFDPYIGGTIVHHRYYGGKGYSDSIFPAFHFLRLFEEIGLPLNLFSDPSIFAVKWIENYSPLWSISLLVRSKEKDAINKWFDRISAATFDKKIVQQIQPILLKSWRHVIKFIIKDPVETLYDKPLNDYLRYFGILSEVISRLCLHFDDEELHRLLRDAMGIYNSPPLPGHKRSAPESLCNIFRRVIWAMSEDRLFQEIYHLLSLPMPEKNSIAYSAGGRWEDPLAMVPWRIEKYRIKFPKDFDRGIWDSPIKSLINTVKNGGQINRPIAINRLKAIYEIGGLTEEEEKNFGTAIWSWVDQYGLPECTGLYKSEYFLLPAPEKGKIKDLIKRYLLKSAISAEVGTLLFTARFFHHTAMGEGFIITWTEEEVSLIFNKLCEYWDERKKKLDSPIKTSIEYVEQRNSKIFFQQYPEIIAQVILPIIRNTNNDQVVKKIENLLIDMEGKKISLNAVKPALLFINKRESASIKNDELEGLNSLNPVIVCESIKGIYFWLCFSSLYDSFPEFPQELLDKLIWVISARRLPGLLDAIEYIGLIVKNLPDRLMDCHINDICKAINYLIDDTSPDIIRERKRAGYWLPIEIKDIPHYRAEVSYLAYLLYKNLNRQNKKIARDISRWKEIFENDPLPEVKKIWKAN
jgi:hypothetical protein